MLKKFLPYLIVGILLLSLIAITWLLLPNFWGNDWVYTFHPAILNLLSGKDPYAIDQFLIPPWGLIPFIGLVWLPPGLAMAIIRVIGLAVYAFVAIRLGAKPLGMVIILLSPQVMHNIINGNIDWLAFLGFVLPPQIGLFFISIKPQIGFALAIFWTVEAYKQKKFLRTFTPFVIVFIISLLVFGWWPLRFTSVQKAYNASAWPISLPFGIVLLYMALRQHKIRIAQAISPLFSPHVMFHSWATFLFALAPNTIELIIAVLSSWLMVGISRTGQI